MKVIISESRLGYGSMMSTISSCEDNGIQCIIDDDNAEVLFYDPANKKYATSKDLSNAGTDIHGILLDKNLYNQVMLNAVGDKFLDFSKRWDALQKESPEKVYRTKKCTVIRGENMAESSNYNPEMDDSIADWYRDAFPTDSEMADEMEVVGSTFYDVWRALNLGKDVYGVIGAEDSIVRERVFQHLSELTGKKYRTIYKMWLASESTEKNNMYNEHLDDPRDWSASEGEVEIMWTRDFPEVGIESGDTEHFVVDFDVVLPNDYDIESNCLKEEVCRLIRKEYPDLDFEDDDFDITNEREFWGDEATRHIYPYDESNVKFDTITDIPDWATTYIMYGDMTEDMTDDDAEMVDAYLAKLAEQGISLIEPIKGSENEFNSYPAFGDACATIDWTCEID